MKTQLIKSAALLCTLLLVPAVAACGQGGSGTTVDTEGNGVGTTAAPIETVDPTQAALDAAVAKLEGVDYSGYDFRFLDRSDEKDPNWETIDIYAEEADGDTITDAVYARNRLLEEKINIKISEHKVFDPYVDARTSIMAGSDDFDLMTDGLQQLATLAAEGYLVDLNSVSQLKLSSEWWDQDMRNDLSIGGKLFFATGDISIMDNYGTWCIMFNKDIAAEYDLPDLYGLVNAGTWTLDKMYDMAKAVTKDTNGDSQLTKEDQWGFLTEAYNEYGLWAAGDQRITTKDSDDLPALMPLNDRSYSALELVTELTQDKASTLLADKVEGGCGFTNEHFGQGNALFIYGGMWLITKYRGYDVNFGVIPAPKFDEAQERYYNTYSYSNCTGYSLPTTSLDLARTGTIMEAMAEISKFTLTPAYYDVALKGKYIRDEESAEMLDIILAQRAYDLGMIFDWGGMFSTILGFATSNNRDFSSSIAKRESAAVKAIEKFVEQLDALE